MSAIFKYFFNSFLGYFIRPDPPVSHPSVNRPHSRRFFTTDCSLIIDRVPRELLLKICSYLENMTDATHFGLANRCLSRLLSDELFWDLFLQKNFPDSCANPKLDRRKQARYKQLTTVANNIKAGRCTLQRLGKGLEFGRVYCLIIDGDQLIAGNSSNTIEIRLLETGQQLKVLYGHRGPVNCLAIYGNQLISGSNDHTIKIWNLNTGEELTTLRGHQEPINCIAIYGDQLISGSRDHTIKIWNLKTGEELITFQSHQKPVNCVAVYGDQLISGSSDHTIKFWDLKKGQELKTLQGHLGPVTYITVYGDQLISGSIDGTMKIWDLKTGQKVKTLEGDRWRFTNTIAVYDHKLIFGSGECRIKICDLKTGQELQAFETASFCFALNNGKLISSSWDYMVRDFNFLSFSPYSKNALKKNLGILREMASQEYQQQPKAVKKSSQSLDLYFRRRLREHSCKMGASCPYSTEVILRVQTEVYVELLLKAIYDKEDDKVSEFLGELMTIDAQNSKIYELLWEIGGKPDVCLYPIPSSVENFIFDKANAPDLQQAEPMSKQPMCMGDADGCKDGDAGTVKSEVFNRTWYKWGEFAFHNLQGYSASYYQKEQAVLAFKQMLRARWNEQCPSPTQKVMTDSL